MSYVELVSKSHLNYMPQALSDQLLERYHDAIEQVDAHLNKGVSEERHKTLSLVSTLNDRVVKDVDLAKQLHGFCSADTFVSLGMQRMAYLPEPQKPAVELMYRVMLLGALQSYTINHPRYRDEARRQAPEHEKGIAAAYTRLHGGDEKEGKAFATSACAMIHDEAAKGMAR